MPGAPLLLQANRRHADRHLLDGNAGSTPSNDLENCRWVSPSPGQGHAGSVLCFLLLRPSPFPLLPKCWRHRPSFSAWSPGRTRTSLPPHHVDLFVRSLSLLHLKTSDGCFFPAVDVEEWGRMASHQCWVARGMGAGTVPRHPGPAVGFGRVKGAVRLTGFAAGYYQRMELFFWWCF